MHCGSVNVDSKNQLGESYDERKSSWQLLEYRLDMNSSMLSRTTDRRHPCSIAFTPVSLRKSHMFNHPMQVDIIYLRRDSLPCWKIFNKDIVTCSLSLARFSTLARSNLMSKHIFGMRRVIYWGCSWTYVRP